MLIGKKVFDLENEMYIMGILNVTPDSFSDGGRFNNIESAVQHAEQMINEGADIIDVGGESTRPGYTLISDEEEISRVVPVIKAIKEKLDVPVSIDTYKSKVARAAIEAGADLVNDIWGLKYDSEMADVIVKYNVPCCLMHNRKEAVYEDYLRDVVADLQECIDIAHRAGIKSENIILDPGVGFGKTYEQNLSIINHLEDIKNMGYPVLLGTSRKSVVGLTLDVPAGERMVGTAVTTVVGVMKGCAIYRVHDCLENKQAIRMTRAILAEKRV
jgi:dihydropteroate synthase